MLGRGSHLGTWCVGLRDDQEGPGIPSLTGLGFHLCHTRVLCSSPLHSGPWHSATSGTVMKPRSRGRHKSCLKQLFSAAPGPEPRAVLITSPPVTRPSPELPLSPPKLSHPTILPPPQGQLLLLRSWVRFPVPAWQLVTICSSSFIQFQGSGIPCCLYGR